MNVKRRKQQHAAELPLLAGVQLIHGAQNRHQGDRGPQPDERRLLRINFNMTFTKMTCEHLTLDVSDSLGSVRSAAVRLQLSALQTVQLKSAISFGREQCTQQPRVSSCVCHQNIAARAAADVSSTTLLSKCHMCRKR